MVIERKKLPFFWGGGFLVMTDEEEKGRGWRKLGHVPGMWPD